MYLLCFGWLFFEIVFIEVGGDEFYLIFDKGYIVLVVEGLSCKMFWCFVLWIDFEVFIKFW